jgi:NitT/TauT family transport system ATP-binding protein
MGAETVRGKDGAPLVEIRDLTVHYTPGGAPAVERLSLDVHEGEFVCVLGPSGCGKSTLLQVLSGLLTPSGGTAKVAGRSVLDSGRGDHRISYVFQEHRLLPWRTVRDNLRITLKAAGVAPEEWDERIDRYLGMLEVGAYSDAWPLQLSGGQRNRVGIGRALVCKPTLILMDEPFSTLDEITARTLRAKLLEVHAKGGQTVVFVTHSIREAVYLADRVVLLTRGPGRVLEDLEIELPRPRDYESADLAAIEEQIVKLALAKWGVDE